MLTSDQEKPEEHQLSGLRHRGAHSRSNRVASSASSKPLTPTTIAWEDQQPQYARSAIPLIMGSPYHYHFDNREEVDSSILERIFNFCEKVASYCIIP